MGSFTKIIMTHKTPFWREKGYSGESLILNKDHQKFPVNYTFDTCFYETKDQSTLVPALVAFVVSTNGKNFSMTPTKERKELVLNHMAKLFGEEAKHPVEYHEKDWSTDPFARGCPVNQFAPGSASEYTNLRDPFGLVHFAGTETAAEWNGYLDGAIESGKRAALEVQMRMEGITMYSGF
jgi:monoamine oxidase